MTSDVVTMRRLRLEQLQRLCDDDKRTELQTAIATYSTKELRTLCGGFGVPAQSKEYAAYQSKAGYSELLVKLLEAKTASSTGITEPAEFVPITDTYSGRTRKTKNCNLRLTNVIFSAAMAPYPVDLMDEIAKKKSPSPLWEKVRTEFLSTKPEYAKIRYPDDQVFAEFNLASPVAHSSEKLQKMWEKLGLAYVSVYMHIDGKGSNDADWSTCAGRHDVYYLSRWLIDRPEMVSIVCKTPKETQNGAQSAPQSALQSVQSIQRTMQQSLQPIVEQNAVTHVPTPVMEPVAVSSKDDEGERLMKSIKLAYDVLAVMPAIDRGAEIERTVRRRLQRCAKRLKTLEDEQDRQTMNL